MQVSPANNQEQALQRKSYTTPVLNKYGNVGAITAGLVKDIGNTTLGQLGPLGCISGCG